MRLKYVSIVLFSMILTNQLNAGKVYKGVYNDVPILNTITKNNTEFKKERYLKKQHLVFLERYNDFIFEKKALKLKELLVELPLKDVKRTQIELDYTRLVENRVVQKKLYFTRLKNY